MFPDNFKETWLSLVVISRLVFKSVSFSRGEGCVVIVGGLRFLLEDTFIISIVFSEAF